MQGKLNSLWKKVVSGQYSIDALATLKDTIFRPTYEKIKANALTDKEEIRAFLQLCLDYYVYSSDGSVLISDYEYDDIMNIWKAMGNAVLVYADTIVNYSTWPMIKHKAPGMVGTVSKMYSYDELVNYLNNYKGIKHFILAPKYDGDSTCVEVESGIIKSGVTRSDGYMGQDITPVLKGAGNSDVFKNKPDGFYKCELVVTKDSFNELINEKKYANRRSATTGIINSPKNLIYAKYITIIPLAYFDGKSKVVYFPPDMEYIDSDNPEYIMKRIKTLLKKIHSPFYQARVDGVILYPVSKDLPVNLNDIMDNAKAYKINTAFARSPIEYAYLSIGRLGNAVPMLHVYPVEVNETIVTDVSLGSYDKYAAMDLHEGETVLIYSAGDVIPQARIPEDREYDPKAPYIKIPLECPYCHEKLTRFGREYKCVNPDCERVRTGIITNFLVKLGAENISDKTVEDLYEHDLLRNIQGLFKLTVHDIAELPGYDITSATKIVNEIQKIRTKGIPVSEFFGALGIPDISTKKCRLIFSTISLKKALKSKRHKIRSLLLDTKGIGGKTADIFCEFIIVNREVIEELIEKIALKDDVSYDKNVVFTKFRDPELAKKFVNLGIEVSDNVTSKTIAVICASYNQDSTKCNEAKRRGISIVALDDVDQLLSRIENESW
jgi:DNA ligase (NAD+)